MTIAAGFVCPDGIVLAADSEVAYAGSKAPEHKIFSLIKGGAWSIDIAGAGTMDLVRMMFDDLEFELKPTHDLPALRNKIIERAEYFRDHYIWPSAMPGRALLALQLLVSIRMADGQNLLLKVDGSDGALVNRVVFSEFIGVGAEVARPVSAWVFKPGIKMEVVRQLAEQIVRWTKAQVPGCGGESSIYILPRKGGVLASGEMWMDRETEFFWNLNEFLQPILEGCIDVSMRDDEFEMNIDRFAERMREGRRKSKEERAARIDSSSPVSRSEVGNPQIVE